MLGGHLSLPGFLVPRIQRQEKPGASWVARLAKLVSSRFK